MSKEFYNYYKNLLDNFTILRKNNKKHIYRIKDGILHFDIDLKKAECSMCKNVKTCNLKKCVHIYKLFQNIYSVPYNYLQFLWINDNYLKVLKNEEIIIQSSDTECSICLEDAGLDGYNENKIKHCLDCGRFYHYKCLSKANIDKECLNCKENGLPDWLK